MNGTTTRRKYVLTRITAGDYLLPSNDAQTIWRIARYTDGPSAGLDDLPRDREFWGVWRARRLSGSVVIDVENWDEWEMVAGACETRAEAITEALRLS